MDNTLREKREKSLKEQLLKYILDEDIQNIGFYYGFYPEINTPLIIEDIFKLTNSSLYLPRIEANYQLSFRQILADEDLETVQRKIKQPKSTSKQINVDNLDLLIVPGVAYQENGYRIGFGGGYYDRVLAKSDVETVSLIFEEQLYPNGTWEVELHDIPIKRLIMPKEGE